MQEIPGYFNGEQTVHLFKIAPVIFLHVFFNLVNLSRKISRVFKVKGQEKFRIGADTCAHAEYFGVKLVVQMILAVEYAALASYNLG